MTARYDEMLQRIRDRLDAEFGPFTWYRLNGRTWGSCGKKFPRHLGGRTTTSPMWVFDRNIPDDQWPHAERIVADITAEYGFATMGLQIDRPGDHTTSGFDTILDAHYSFATNLATVLRGEQRLPPLHQSHPVGAVYQYSAGTLTDRLRR